MASKKKNLLEQHVEKAVLGVSVAVLAYVSYAYLLGQPAVIKIGSNTAVTPDKVDLEVANQLRVLETRLASKSPDKDDNNKDIRPVVPDFAAKFQAAFAGGVRAHLGLDRPLPPAVAWNSAAGVPSGPVAAATPGPGRTTTEPPVPAGLAVLPKLAAPTDLRTTAGFSYVVPQAAPLAPGARPVAATTAGEEKHWVSVIATLDRTAQLNALRAARFPSNFLQVFYLRTELERREVLPGGGYGPTQVITPLPTVALHPLPPVPAGEVITTSAEWLKIIEPSDRESFVARILSPAYQEKVLQPPMLACVGDGDQWTSPFGAVARPTGRPTTMPSAIPGAVTSDASFVWAHDTTVLPGKTYEYRLRAFVFNRLAGFPARLLNPADARVLELPTPWSAWSAPVTVPPDVEWFLTGGGGLGGAATATVYKIFPGNRPVSSVFKVEPGLPIGGSADVALLGRDGPRQKVAFETGAVLLDVRAGAKLNTLINKPGGTFDLSPNQQETTVIVYRDSLGNVLSRSLLFDRVNARKKALDARIDELKPKTTR